jgi:rhodanese-related sulfurtransferase
MLLASPALLLPSHSVAPRSSHRCGQVASSAVPIPEVVPADEAFALLSSGGAILLDVRQPAEYRLDGHAPSYVQSINVPSQSWEHGFYLPLESFSADAVSALADGAGVPIDAAPEGYPPVIVACADGRLAAAAVTQLRAAGVEQCGCCEGGLRALEAEGMEMEVDEDGEAGLNGAWV